MTLLALRLLHHAGAEATLRFPLPLGVAMATLTLRG